MAGSTSPGPLCRDPSPATTGRFRVPAAPPPRRAPRAFACCIQKLMQFARCIPRIAVGGRSRTPQARQLATLMLQKLQSQTSDRIAASPSRPPSAVAIPPLSGLVNQHGSQAVTNSLSCIGVGGGRRHGRRPARSHA